MSSLIVAIGNPLRGDDGAARDVVQQLGSLTGIDAKEVIQLLPETAAEIAGYDHVVFLDADSAAEILSFGPVTPAATLPPMTHIATPESVVGIATRLYGFRGQAYYCRIPAREFGFGETLSPFVRTWLDVAARGVAALLDPPEPR